MALQGDLDSFALPDVLRLLAGTGKTGRLAITATATSGELWLLDGDLVGGRVEAAPHASVPADVVFELIRLGGGAFVFEDGERLVDGSERARVNDAVESAEQSLAEWAEVEQSVPSVHAPVRLVSEIGGEPVTVAAGQWRLLASIGADTTIRRLGDRWELTDLAISRQVKDLLDAGMIELGHVAGPDDAPADAQEALTDDRAQAALGEEPAHAVGDGGVGPDRAQGDHGDLDILAERDMPVVMESSDDAWLPEPLPAASSTFDAPPVPAPYEAPPVSTPFDAPADHETDQAPASGGLSEAFGADAAEPRPGWPAADQPVSDAPWTSVEAFGTDDLTGASGRPEDPAAEPVPDDDRGSLMRFLSRVEP